MRIRLFLFPIFVLLFLLLSSCRSEFERVRTSGDASLLLAKANDYYDVEEYQKAQTLYELVLGPFRGTKEAEQIAFRYAYTYFYTEQYVLASYYFKNFAATYGGSLLKEEADFMNAYSNYKMSPVFRLDQTYTLKAIESFGEFANLYPNSERLNQINSLIDEMRAKLEEKDFAAAKLYLDLRRYPSAIRSFDNLLIEYPETKRDEQIRYLICQSAYESAKGSFVELQLERFEEALERCDFFLRRYPSSPQVEEVKKYREQSNNRLNQLKNG